MKKRIIMKLAALFMTGILAVEGACAGIGDNNVYAAETDAVESESDGADSEFTGASGTGWILDADGLLTINGDPEYVDSGYGFYNPEWYNYNEKIKTVEVGAFKPESTSNWFYGCDQLQSISFNESFDTSNVTDMSSMFAGCDNLISLDVRGFDTSNVTNMSYMFNSCSCLESLDIRGFDTSKVTDMSGMFGGCGNLANLDVRNLDTSNVKKMAHMFGDCYALTSLDVKSLNTSQVTDMTKMFGNCKSMTSLDLKGFDTSNVTNMSHMFEGCNSLIGLNLSGWNTSHVTNMSSMFEWCSKLSNLDVSGIDTSQCKNMKYMFLGCENLISLDVRSFDTSNVTNMSFMFWGCSSLTSLDLGNFDTSQVTSMDSMFWNCHDLTNINLSGWDTSHVDNFFQMFQQCSSLKSIDVSGFDTSQVRIISDMFKGCDSLERIKPFVGFGWDLSLPCETMYDIKGKAYTAFPKGLSQPMTLYASIPTSIAATSVSMKEKTLTINTSDRYMLSYTYAPVDCTDEPMWNSSDSSIVSVNSVGVITSGTKEGKVVITVSLGTHSDSCEVTVKKSVPPSDDVTTPDTDPSVSENETAAPTPTVIPSKDSASSDRDTVSTKSISGLPKGAQILDAGGSVNLKPVVKTADGANGSATWIAPVGHVLDAVAKEDGSLDIKAVGPGTAYVTIVSGTKTKTVKYNVKQPVKKVDTSVNAINLGIGEKYRLCVIPDAPTTDKFYFESSDKGICTVDQKGLIKAKKTEGSATITIYAYDKKSDKKNRPVASIAVTIESKEAPAVNVTDASINYLGNKELYVGEMGYISTLINGGANNGGAAVKYTMDNKGIVKIDSYGHVTAKKAGTVTITATCGEKTDSIMLTVKQPLKLYKVNKSYVRIAAPKAGKSSKKVTFTVKTNPTTKMFTEGGGKVIWTVTSKDTGISLKSDDGKGKAVFEVPSGALDTIVTATINDPVTGKSYSTDCMIDVK